MEQENGKFSYENYVVNVGNLLSVEEARRHFQMSREQFMDLMEKGYFDHCLVRVGKDISPKKNGWNAKVYFNEHEITKMNRSDIGCSLKEVAEQLNENYRWLRDLSSNKPELLKGARIGRYLWDIKWFEKNLKQLHEQSYHNRGKHRTSEFYEMLTDNQKKWIEDYLHRRKNGHGIKVGRKLEWSKKPDKPEKAISDWRKDLSIIFYRIICGRSGIKNFHELERLGKYRKLSDSEWKQFDPNLFQVIDFGPSDMEFVTTGYKSSSIYLLNERVLTPFLYFVLNKLKEDWVELKQKSLYSDIVKKEDLERKKELYESFEMSVELALSKAPTTIEIDEEDQRDPIFLTYEQVIDAKNKIRSDASLQEPLKRVVIFMIGCLLGIRPDEFANLKIRDFEINETTGLLKRFYYDHKQNDIIETTDDDLGGWGRLFIRYNKGGYSPSHPKLGTLVPPRLATLINYYLETEFYSKDQAIVGKGFLVRPKWQLPDKKYTARGLSQWITAFSNEKFDFLSEKDRKSFKYYDVRHTVYNLLIKGTVVENMKFEIQERAAQIHARHDIKMKSGNTGRKSYTSDITMREYYTVINDVLNFPWEKEAYLEWAIEKGYVLKDKTEKEIKQDLTFDLSDQEREKLQELEKELGEKINLANKLANGPTGEYRNVEKWTEKTILLEKEIKQIESEIASIKKLVT